MSVTLADMRHVAAHTHIVIVGLGAAELCCDSSTGLEIVLNARSSVHLQTLTQFLQHPPHHAHITFLMLANQGCPEKQIIKWM